MIWHKILKRGAHPESDIQGCEKGRGRGRRVLVVVALAWLLTVAPLPWPVPTVMAATFTVNTTNDTADANPGDGVCADSAGRCSLRAAVMEANALGGGPHTIVLQAGQTYTL
ncbi:CSLREA domain-containing protein [Chloroflexus sp. MS-G]|uniref:CSLREA domain-containing protein n=1 Tax=Chloroflexus sp. MS-G TaxID=1521187 RepID=UPI000689BA50|nr:CSLREA domain-containing protein [Chloroflexus sp. MS-G]